MKSLKNIFIKHFKIKAFIISLIIFSMLATNFDVFAFIDSKDFEYQTQEIVAEDKKTSTVSLQLNARNGITYKSIHYGDEEIPFSENPETKAIEATKEVQENGFYTFTVSYEMQDENVAGEEPSVSNKTTEITYEVTGINLNDEISETPEEPVKIQDPTELTKGELNTPVTVQEPISIDAIPKATAKGRSASTTAIVAPKQKITTVLYGCYYTWSDLFDIPYTELTLNDYNYSYTGYNVQVMGFVNTSNKHLGITTISLSLTYPDDSFTLSVFGKTYTFKAKKKLDLGLVHDELIFDGYESFNAFYVGEKNALVVRKTGTDTGDNYEFRMVDDNNTSSIIAKDAYNNFTILPRGSGWITYELVILPRTKDEPEVVVDQYRGYMDEKIDLDRIEILIDSRGLLPEIGETYPLYTRFFPNYASLANPGLVEYEILAGDAIIKGGKITILGSTEDLVIKGTVEKAGVNGKNISVTRTYRASDFRTIWKRSIPLVEMPAGANVVDDTYYYQDDVTFVAPPNTRIAQVSSLAPSISGTFQNSLTYDKSVVSGYAARALLRKTSLNTDQIEFSEYAIPNSFVIDRENPVLTAKMGNGDKASEGLEYVGNNTIKVDFSDENLHTVTMYQAGTKEALETVQGEQLPITTEGTSSITLSPTDRRIYYKIVGVDKSGRTVQYTCNMVQPYYTVRVGDVAFPDATYGYSGTPDAKQIPISLKVGNATANATIKNVTIDNTKEFILTNRDSNWYLQPKDDVQAGLAQTIITVTYNQNKVATANATFKVNQRTANVEDIKLFTTPLSIREYDDYEFYFQNIPSYLTIDSIRFRNVQTPNLPATSEKPQTRGSYFVDVYFKSYDRNYSSNSKTYRITIYPIAAPDKDSIRLEGTQLGEPGYFSSNVTMKPPVGYQISTMPTTGFSDALLFQAEKGNPRQYKSETVYLKKISGDNVGAITNPFKTNPFAIDIDAPQISCTIDEGSTHTDLTLTGNKKPYYFDVGDHNVQSVRLYMGDTAEECDSSLYFDEYEYGSQGGQESQDGFVYYPGPGANFYRIEVIDKGGLKSTYKFLIIGADKPLISATQKETSFNLGTYSGSDAIAIYPANATLNGKIISPDNVVMWASSADVKVDNTKGTFGSYTPGTSDIRFDLYTEDKSTLLTTIYGTATFKTKESTENMYSITGTVGKKDYYKSNVTIAPINPNYVIHKDSYANPGTKSIEIKSTTENIEFYISSGKDDGDVYGPYTIPAIKIDKQAPTISGLINDDIVASANPINANVSDETKLASVMYARASSKNELIDAKALFSVPISDTGLESSVKLYEDASKTVYYRIEAEDVAGNVLSFLYAIKPPTYNIDVEDVVFPTITYGAVRPRKKEIVINKKYGNADAAATIQSITSDNPNFVVTKEAEKWYVQPKEYISASMDVQTAKLTIVYNREAKATATASIMVNQSANPFTVKVADNIYYGTDYTIDATDLSTDSPIIKREYKVKGAADSAYSLDQPTAVGNYDVRLTSKASVNYFKTTKEGSFTIKYLDTVNKDNVRVSGTGSVTNWYRTDVTLKPQSSDYLISLTLDGLYTNEIILSEEQMSESPVVYFKRISDNALSNGVTLDPINIDKVAPTITGIENSGSSKEQKEAIVSDSNLHSVKLFTKIWGSLDSEVVTDIPISNGKSVIALTVPSSGSISYRIEVKDKSGNETVYSYRISAPKYDVQVTGPYFDTLSYGSPRPARQKININKKYDKADTEATISKVESSSSNFEVTKTGDDWYLQPIDGLVVSTEAYSTTITATYNDGKTATGSSTLNVKRGLNPFTISMENTVYFGVPYEPIIGSVAENATITMQYKEKGTNNYYYSSTKPTAAGDYTVRATSSLTANYQSTEKTVDFTITKAAVSDSEITVSGTLVEPGYYSSPVMFTAPEGYDISATESGTFTSFVLYSDDGNFYPTFYLKRKSDGAISSPVNLSSFIIDKTAPSITGITNNGSSKAEATATVSDATLKSVKLFTSTTKDTWTDNGTNVVISGTTSTIRLPLSTATTQYYKIEAADITGHTTTYQFTVEAPKYQININDILFDAVSYGYTRPASKAIAIDFQYGFADATATISSISTTSTDFEITKLGATWYIQPKAGLAYRADPYTALITATYDNGLTASATASITVNKGKNPFTISQGDITYGTSVSPTATNTNGATITFEYKKATDEDSAYSETIPTNAGKYNVRGKGTETTNYLATTSAVVNFTIAKAPNVFTVSQADVEFGTPLSHTATDTNGAAVTYEYERTRIDGSKYYVSIVPTDAGTYQFRGKSEELENYQASTSEISTFTISKADNPFTVTLANLLYYGNKYEPLIKSVGGSAPTRITYKKQTAEDSTYNSTKPKEEGAYTVKVATDETTNYKATEKTIDYTIERITPTAADVIVTGNNNSDSDAGYYRYPVRLTPSASYLISTRESGPFSDRLQYDSEGIVSPVVYLHRKSDGAISAPINISTFTIDDTNPVLSGIVNNGSATNDRNADIYDKNLKSVKLYASAQRGIWTGEGKDIPITDGRSNVNLPLSKVTTQYYKIEAIDKSGNKVNYYFTIIAPIYSVSVGSVSFDSITYGSARPLKKEIKINRYYGNATASATIASVESSSDDFEITSGPGSWYIQPKDGLKYSASSYTTTITVTYDNGLKATAQASIYVNKATNPFQIILNTPIYYGTEYTPTTTALEDGSEVAIYYKEKQQSSSYYSSNKPTAAGNYTVRVSVTSPNYSPIYKDLDFSIVKITPDASEITVSGTMVDPGFYSSDVTLMASSDYEMSLTEQGTYTSSITYSENGTITPTVYLKRKSDGAISGQVSVSAFTIDKEAPVISGITNNAVSKLPGTAEVSDLNLKSVKLFTSTTAGSWTNAGVDVTVTGTKSTVNLPVSTVTTQYYKIVALDKSGNTTTYYYTVGAPVFNIRVEDVAFDAVEYGYSRPVGKPIAIDTKYGAAEATATVSKVESSNTNFEITKTGSQWIIQPKTGLGYSATAHSTTITATYDNGLTATAKATMTVNKGSNPFTLALASPVFYGATYIPSIGSIQESASTKIEYKKKAEADSAYTGTRPTAVGDYTVRVTTGITTNYKATSKTVDYTIAKIAPTADVITVNGTLGDEGFYRSDVILTASSAYLISATETGSYTSSITYSAIGVNTPSVFIKRKSDGAISSAVSISSFTIDKTAPSLTGITNNGSSKTAGVATITDTNLKRVKLYTSITAGSWTGNGVDMEVSGTSSTVNLPLSTVTTQYYKIEALDKAGNTISYYYTVIAPVYQIHIDDISFGEVDYGYAKPASKAIAIDFQYESADALATVNTVTTTSTEFEITKTGNAWYIQPVARLTARVNPYTATITATYDNGLIATATASMTVNKCKNPFKVSQKNVSYGTALTPTVEDNVENSTITYEYKLTTQSDSNFSTVQPTASGTYHIRGKSSATANYLATTSEVSTFTIGKMNNLFTVSQANVKYGEALSPTNTNSVAGVTVIYEYKLVSAADSAYTQTMPSDAGEYNIRGVSSETAGYLATTSEASTFKIAKISNSFTVNQGDVNFKTALTPTNTNTVADATITYEYKNASDSDATYSSTVPSDAGSYYIRGISSATKNYNETISAGVPFTIAKIDNPFGLSLASVVYYGGSYLPTITSVQENAAVTTQYKMSNELDDGYESIAPTALGSYTVRVTVASTKNYKETIKTLNYAIKRMTPAPTAADITVSGTKGDSNFYRSNVTLTPTATYQISKTETGTYASSLEYSVDGNTTPSVYLKRKADGAVSEMITVSSFIVDKTLPSITGIVNNGVSQKEETATITDTNLKSVKYWSSATENSWTGVGTDVTITDGAGTIALPVALMEPRYYKIEAIDKAGNTTEYTYTMGSTIPSDINITVSGTEGDAGYYRDATITCNVNYALSINSDEGPWSAGSLVLTDDVEVENIYVKNINIGSPNYGKIYGPIEKVFVFDKTKPSISGIENNLAASEAKTATITDKYLKSVKLWTSTSKDTWTGAGSDITVSGTTSTVDLPKPATGIQYYKIEAIDKAGNSKTYTYTIDPSGPDASYAYVKGYQGPNSAEAEPGYYLSNKYNEFWWKGGFEASFTGPNGSYYADVYSTSENIYRIPLGSEGKVIGDVYLKRVSDGMIFGPFDKTTYLLKEPTIENDNHLGIKNHYMNRDVTFTLSMKHLAKAELYKRYKAYDKGNLVDFVEKTEYDLSDKDNFEILLKQDPDNFSYMGADYEFMFIDKAGQRFFKNEWHMYNFDNNYEFNIPSSLTSQVYGNLDRTWKELECNAMDINKNPIHIVSYEVREDLFDGKYFEFMKSSETGKFYARIKEGVDLPYKDTSYNAAVYVVYSDGHRSYSRFAELKIKKANNPFTVGLPNDIYVGNSYEPTIASVAENARITTLFKKQGEEDSTYSNIKPTAVGDYTVKVSSSETANYLATEKTANYSIQNTVATASDITMTGTMGDEGYYRSNVSLAPLSNFTISNSGATGTYNDLEVLYAIDGSYTPTLYLKRKNDGVISEPIVWPAFTVDKTLPVITDESGMSNGGNAITTTNKKVTVTDKNLKEVKLYSATTQAGLDTASGTTQTIKSGSCEVTLAAQTTDRYYKVVGKDKAGNEKSYSYAIIKPTYEVSAEDISFTAAKLGYTTRPAKQEIVIDTKTSSANSESTINSVTTTNTNYDLTTNNGKYYIQPKLGLAEGTYNATITITYNTNKTASTTATFVVGREVVTNITGAVSAAITGEEVALTGTVAPSDASYKTIIWSIKNAGTTGATLSNGKLKTTEAGTVKLTATIANGAASGNYTQDFDITVTRGNPADLTCELSEPLVIAGWYNNNVVVTPPTGYTIATSYGGSYGATLTIGATNASPKVYLKKTSTGTLYDVKTLSAINLDKISPVITGDTGMTENDSIATTSDKSVTVTDTNLHSIKLYTATTAAGLASATGVEKTLTAGSTTVTLPHASTNQYFKVVALDKAGNETIYRYAILKPIYNVSVTDVAFAELKVGYTQPAAQEIVINKQTASANAEATISSVTTTSTDFVISKKNDKYYIQPKAGLENGTYTAPISVAYDEDGKATANATFTVSRTPVTNITGTVSTAITGNEVTLTGTVAPSDASYKTIAWTLKNTGGTNARISNGKLTATEAGTVKVTATINKGTANGNYTKDFDIAVTRGNPQDLTCTITAATGLAGWYNKDVVVTAPTGYQIASSFGGTYANTLTFNATTATPQVYLKNVINGTLYDAKTLAAINIDKSAPTITGETDMSDGGSEISVNDKTVTVTDTNLQSVDLYTADTAAGLSTATAVSQTITAGSTTLDVNLNHSETDQFFKVVAKDNAGTQTVYNYAIIKPVYGVTVADVAFDTELVGYSQPSAKEIMIDKQSDSANVEATIASVTTSDEFVIAGSNGSYFIQPVAGLETGSYAAKITVTYDNGATVEADVTFGVGKEVVTDITDPITAAITGNEVTLTGTVAPINASYKTIVWSVKDAGETGATITDGVLKATEAGTVKVTATIAKGTETGAFTKEFEIAVTRGDPTGLTCDITAATGIEDWYNTDVTVTAPIGYQLSSTFGGTYSDSLTYNTTTVTPNVYLKHTENGTLYDATALNDINIDKTAPSFTAEEGMVTGGSEISIDDKSITVSDTNLHSVELFTASTAEDLVTATGVTQTITSGSSTVTFTHDSTDQHFKVVAKDKAGNEETYTYAIIKPVYGISMVNIIFDELKLGYTQPDAQEIVIDKQTSNANLEATISSVVSDNENYVITESEGKYYIQPNADLVEGTYTANITVTYNGDATETTQATFIVSREVVTDITGTVSTAISGENVTLTGTVAPIDASYKDIVWSVKDAGETGATITDNVLTTMEAGTLKVTATITNGTATGDFVKDVDITVTRGDPKDLVCTLTAATGITDWYNVDVVVTPPTGYTIASSFGGTYADTLTLDATTATPSVYLKNTTTGALYDAKVLSDINIDKVGPTITGEAGMESGGNEISVNDKTLTVADTNLHSVELFTAASEADLDSATGVTQTITDGSSTVSLTHAATSQYFKVVAEDKAGNKTTFTYGILVPVYGVSVETITFDSVKFGYVRPDEREIVINKQIEGANSEATIKSVESSTTDFEITLKNGKYYIQPKAGLAEDGYETTVTVTYNGDATATAKVSFSVGREIVTNITDVVTSAITGEEVTLSGTVVPDEATHSDIVWSIKDAGTTKATLTADKLVTYDAGTVVVTATIANGGAKSDYTQDFNIVVTRGNATDLVCFITQPTGLAGWYNIDVTVTPPEGYEIASTFGDTYSSTLTYNATSLTPTVYLKKTDTGTLYDAKILTAINIDKTVPTITGETGMSDNGSETTASNKTVTVSDTNLETVTLYTAASAADLEKATGVEQTITDGSSTVTLGAASSDQYFKVVAEDKAGNDATYKYTIINPIYGISVTDVAFGALKVGYTQPVEREIPIDKQLDTANKEATIKSVTTTSSDFVISEKEGKYYIQPNAGLVEGTYSATITVTYNGDETQTATATFTVEKVTVDEITMDVSTAITGEEVTITGTVAPTNATSQTIVWTLKNAGTTGATFTDGVLHTTEAGTVVMTATVADGTLVGDYTQDFNIVVSRGDSTGLTCTITEATGIAGWYKTDVTVTPPTGYNIASSFGGTYADSVTFNATPTAPNVYLKNTATGTLYDATTFVGINIDKTVPTITGEAGMSTGGSEFTSSNKTVTVSDTNLVSIDLYTASTADGLDTAVAVPQIIAANSTSEDITLVAADTDKHFKVVAKDKAGNETTYTYTIVAPKFIVTVDDITFTSVEVGYERPVAQEIIINTQNEGANANATIASVTTTSTDFEITAKAGKYYIQPKADLAAGTKKATITVTYDGNESVTAKATFVIQKIANPFTATVPDVYLGEEIVVEVENLMGATKDMLGYDYKIAGVYGSVAPTERGNYTIKITSPDVEGYKATSVEVAFKIINARNKFDLIQDDVDYLETVSPVVKNMDETTKITYSYKVKGSKDNTYTSTVPTTVNDYTVRAVSEETELHAVSTKTKDFKIKAIDNPFTLTQGDVAYKGKPKPTVTGVTENAAITYTYKLDGEAEFVSEVPEAVGSYTLKASSAATANYNATEKTVTFEIYPVLSAKNVVLSPEMAQAITSIDDLMTYHAVTIDPVDDSAMSSIVSETTSLADIKAGKEGTYKVKYTLGKSSVEVKVQVLKAGYDVDVDGNYAMRASDAMIGKSKLAALTKETLFKTCKVEVINSNVDKVDMSLFNADMDAIKALPAGKHSITLTYGTLSSTITLNVINDDPVMLITLPSGIKMDETRYTSEYEAQAEETISVSTTTEADYFTENIYIKAKPTVKLKNTENDQFFNVQLYSSEDKALKDTDNTLMVLNVASKRSDTFYMRMKSNRKNDRGKYKGKIDFEVKYDE